MPWLQSDGASFQVQDRQILAHVANNVQGAAIVRQRLVEELFVRDGKKPRILHEVSPRADVGVNLVITGVLVQLPETVQFNRLMDECPPLGRVVQHRFVNRPLTRFAVVGKPGAAQNLRHALYHPAIHTVGVVFRVEVGPDDEREVHYFSAPHHLQNI